MKYEIFFFIFDILFMNFINIFKILLKKFFSDEIFINNIKIKYKIGNHYKEYI